jgi:hypothetical protein
MTHENENPENTLPPSEMEAEPADESDEPGEPGEPRRPLRISLESELSNLSYCVRAVEVLTGQLEARAYGDEESERDAPSCIRAMAGLVGARMELIRSVIHGEQNPALLWEPYNSVTDHMVIPPGEDIILTEWTAKRRAPN